MSLRRGAAPQPGDIPLPGGLHQASLARALAENAIPSRARRGALSRRLTRHELGEWVERAARFGGADELGQVRDQVRTLAPLLGVSAEDAKDLDNLIGAALGTRPVSGLPRSLRQRALGIPYDAERIERCDVLVAALQSAAPQNHPAAPLEPSVLPFTRRTSPTTSRALSSPSRRLKISSTGESNPQDDLKTPTMCSPPSGS